jgi:uncharacterized protein YecE (DUF72 family)
MPAHRDIHVGPAGWSYADWRGRVYPESAGSKFDTLALVAKYFDVVEINSSFYYPPKPETARAWLERTAHNPNFIFTAKLHKVFTHKRERLKDEDEAAFREGIDPLIEAGKLGALLMQFPWSFKNERDERVYLDQLVTRFKIILWSWNCGTSPGTIREFCRHLKTWRSACATSISRSSRTRLSRRPRSLHQLATCACTAETIRTGFVKKRMCSSVTIIFIQTMNWIPGSSASSKSPIKQRQTFVITNNHARGQSLVNAFEILAQLEEARVPGPVKLIEAYPRLVESVEPDDEEPQGSLF